MGNAMSKRNVDLVRSLYAAWSRDDVEAFLQVLAPDVEWRFADSFIYGAVNPVIGRDALLKGVTKWRQYVDTKQFAEAVTETPTTTERSAIRRSR
jgi:SnoaL-like domain